MNQNKHRNELYGEFVILVANELLDGDAEDVGTAMGLIYSAKISKEWFIIEHEDKKLKIKRDEDWIEEIIKLIQYQQKIMPFFKLNVVDQ